MPPTSPAESKFSLKKSSAYIDTATGDLQFIFTKIKVLQALNSKVATYLDENIAKYCQVANLIGPKLILVAANSSIATLIRLQVHDLLLKFQNDPDLVLQKVKEVHCKIHPSFIPPASLPVKTVERLSAETARIVSEIAASLKDPKLKEIMEKIAQRV